ncbi:MAG: hypothetical protein KAI66_23120, partial [Lentisphaeria bacterium]|nr:hypothetical protein [Lentisphaeria bacterium]
MKYRYHINVDTGLDYGCIADANAVLKKGDEVIVQCERYQDFGVVTECYTEGPVSEADLRKLTASVSKGRHVEGHRVPEVIRRATISDKATAKENEEQAKSMHRTAMERVAAHKLDMRLITTHYAFDRKMAVFQFSAEGRVDFRELLRDLSHSLRTRVELRQVGVRDEAAMQGGMGTCGRAFCCSTFLDRFSSINVKMAKVQGLSLNPPGISGACGRLRCCLAYAVEYYRERYEEEKKRRAEERRLREERGGGEADQRGGGEADRRGGGREGGREGGGGGRRPRSSAKDAGGKREDNRRPRRGGQERGRGDSAPGDTGRAAPRSGGGESPVAEEGAKPRSRRRRRSGGGQDGGQRRREGGEQRRGDGGGGQGGEK